LFGASGRCELPRRALLVDKGRGRRLVAAKGATVPTLDTRRAVAIVSGGLDSATMLYLLLRATRDIHVISFDYGQRHRRELLAATEIVRGVGLRHDVIQISGLHDLLRGSALTDLSVDVPEGHYADDTMKVTIVPNRNAIMLSLATAIAVVDGADSVWYAAHAGDHAIYPDCRPDFIDSLSDALRKGNQGFVPENFRILSPFTKMTKAEIVALGSELDVPFADTWSCYVGGDAHCGRCGTCIERAEAFVIARLADPTAYLESPARVAFVAPR